MGAFPVVVVGPGLQMSVALLGVGPVLRVSPLAQGGLDEAFGLAVSSGGVGASTLMADLHGLTSLAELSRAVAGAVVGEQGAHADAVGGEEVGGGGEESDRGFGLLIGQHLGKGQAGVIVHGHMQSQEAGMFLLAPQASIDADRKSTR